MRRIVSLLVFVLALHGVHAQFPGCQINFGCTVAPNTTEEGLAEN